MDTTRDLQMPSGFEVESAAFHPNTRFDETSLTLPERSGVRGKLDTLKSRGMSKVDDLRRVMNDRATAVKGSLVRTKSTVREGALAQVDKAQASMRTNPMLWAGVAAGAGFGLGLIGRIAQWRHKQHGRMPDLVIIESGC